MSRAYTVEEIDRMRYAVEHKWLYGIRPSERTADFMNSRVYMEQEKVACVEEMLRTYMAAGVSPEDLE